jgi:glycosyltransferase involved in cell wall biosynthesis
MDKLKISIVTISFNQADYLQECLNSVENQGISNLEHIVIDGGSSDGTLSVLEEHAKKKLHYEFTWKSESDNGPADALNKGFRMANGKIFGFLNSDDVLLPKALQIVSSYFSDDKVKMIQGSGLIIDGQGALIRPVASIPFSAESFLAKKHVIFQPSIFFRREVYESVDGFNPENKTSWDAEFFVACSLAGYQVQACPNVLSAFRLYSESKSGSGEDFEKIKKDRVRMTEACIKNSISVENFSIIMKLWGWVISSPYILFASYKWLRENGVTNKWKL